MLFLFCYLRAVLTAHAEPAASHGDFITRVYGSPTYMLHAKFAGVFGILCRRGLSREFRVAYSGIRAAVNSV